MKATWLHVSDFHIRGGDPYERDLVLRALVDSVRDWRERGRVPDLIFATGDIAFSGKPAEYEMVTRFFDELLEAAGLERRRLFVIPGNHDVDRTLGIGLARTLSSREEADTYFGPDVPKTHLKLKLGAFTAWYNRYFDGIRVMPESSTCGPVEAVEVGGGRIGVLPLNSAFFCQGDDDYGKLLVGRRALEPAIAELRALKADLNVALVHHPLDWLSDIERSNIRADLHASADVLLRGHLHETDVENVVGASGGFIHVAAGAAYQTLKWPNRAVYGAFDGNDLELFPIRYEDQPQEVWTVDPSLFPRERDYVKTFRIPRFASQPATPAASSPAPAPPPPVTAPRFRSNIPARHNLPFVGRETLLDQMLAELADPLTEAALVVHGQPGVGKSELAREFARRHRDRYPGGRFFVSAGGGAELVDLARIGAKFLDLEFPAGFSLRDQCERTLLSLGAVPVLLIYDNAASPEAIEPWLPPAGMPCHVLITSLSDNWGPRWRLLHVEPLPRDNSLELIERVAGREVTERYGEELATLAGGLPIQLCSAATMIAHEARRGRLDSVELSLAPEAQQSFRLVYERLESPLWLLLHAAAFLNPQRIPREELARELAEGAGWSESDFRKALDGCLNLHLLEGQSELRMHQLFASFLRETPITPDEATRLQRIREVQRDHLVELAHKVVANPADSELAAKMMAFPLNPADWQDLQPGFSTDDWETIGRALYEIGEFRAALPWLYRAAEEKRMGDVQGRVDHASIGKSLYEIGYCLSSIGRYEEAQPWFEGSVAEKQQGDTHGLVDHESLGKSLEWVGNSLSRTGKYEDARPWYERAVVAKERGDVHGRVDHQSLGSSLHEVGYCLSGVGKHMEARPWYERAVLEKQEGDVHGRIDHESLGSSLHQVGYCLLNEEKLKEARGWFERAIAETQHGDVHRRVDHKSLGTSLALVGYCLLSEGKYEDARPWFERAVAEEQQGDIHGRVDHESLGISLYQIGYCLSSEGKYEDARSWYERAVEEMQQGNVHGRVDHESLGKSLHAVGDCFSSQGEDEEAQIWFKRAVEAKRRGNQFNQIDEKSLKQSLAEGAACLRRLGKTEEAEAWETEAAALDAEQAQGMMGSAGRV